MMTQAEAEAETKRRNIEEGRRPAGDGGFWHTTEVQPGEWDVVRRLPEPEKSSVTDRVLGFAVELLDPTNWLN